MDTAQIYEKTLLGDCLDELKSLRDDARREQWYPGSTSNAGHSLPHDLCILSSRSELDYERSVQRSREVLYKGIIQTVVMLISEYDIDSTPIPCGVTNAKIFKALDRSGLAPHENFDISQTFALIISRNGESVLYIFKRFGLGEYWSKDLADYVRGQASADETRYVSLVDEGAYLDQMSHNDDKSDPTRGTGVLSLRQFFDMHFSSKEYGAFRKYLTRLTEDARAYYGYRVVRGLAPNASCLFRREVADAVRSFDYCSADERGKLSVEQKSLLDSQFFGRGACEALTGTSDFASSFMTAEWLYQSLQGSDQIDLAPIIMGYYKAVEQYLFQFLCLHTEDADRRSRKVFVLNEGLVTMKTREDLDVRKNKITLSGLTGFIGHRDKSGITCRNKDLLRQGIIGETHELIVDELESIPADRNGYFHKQNLYDWDEAEKARKRALFLFYLLLGSYEFTKEDAEELGMCKKPYEDDFNMLCDYINECSHSVGEPTRLPIFYINGKHDEEDAMWASANQHIVGYDEKYGIPQYSGVCFIPLLPPRKELLLTKEQIDKVEQGELIISGTSQITLKLSLPKRTIYENGRNLLRE